MTDRTAAERQRKQRERDRWNGLIEVTVKVPKECAETIRRIAAEMRETTWKPPPT
jgi:hypothetical protein